MGLFRKSKPTTASGERLQASLPAHCLGEKCVNYAGQTCLSRLDLLQADGPSGGTDLPPLKGESNYAIYGQVCRGGEQESLVATYGEVLKPGVPMAKIVALAGMHGDLPLHIISGDTRAEVTTLATSD